MDATWTAVTAMVEAAFHVGIHGERWLGLRHGEPGEAVKVRVALTSALGRDWVVVTADVMPVAGLAGLAGLALNHELLVGAIQVEDGRVLLQHQIPATALDAVIVRRVIQYVGVQAAHLRRQVALRIDAFEHYAD